MLNTQTTAEIKNISTIDIMSRSDLDLSHLLKHFTKLPFDKNGRIIATSKMSVGAGASVNFTDTKVAEGSTPSLRVFNYDSKKLTPIRFAEYITVPESIELDTSADLIGIEEQMAIKRILRNIESEITIRGYQSTSSTTEEEKKTKFELLASFANNTSSLVTGTTNQAFSHEELVSMYTDLAKVANVKGGFWFIDPAQLPSIKNVDGEQMIDNKNIITEGSIGTYMGLPVYRTTFGNPSERELAYGLATPRAYSYMIDDFKVYKTEQTYEEAKAGVHTYIVETWAAGTVTDFGARRAAKYSS